MNKFETLQAAEVMRRAAEGEMVECRHRSYADSPWSRADVGFGVGEYNCPCWNWENWEWRVLDFPSPPSGQKWHNPASLNATQVGVHEGFRLLLDSELNNQERTDCERYYGDSGWVAAQPCFPHRNVVCTFRTKSPLPEVKSERPMEGALRNYFNKEIDRHWQDRKEHYCRVGWTACKEHYKIQ